MTLTVAQIVSLRAAFTEFVEGPKLLGLKQLYEAAEPCAARLHLGEAMRLARWLDGELAEAVAAAEQAAKVTAKKKRAKI